MSEAHHIYSEAKGCTLSFGSLIGCYKTAQSGVMVQIQNLCYTFSSANPADFLLLQFQMAQVTQMGESISNMISQVNSVISNSIRNQKTS